MRSLEKAKRIWTAAAIAFGMAVVAACSGGGGSSVVPQQQSQPGSPQSIQTSIPFSDVGSAIALPSIAGYNESITLASNTAAAGALLNLKISTTMPNVPAMPAGFKEAQGFLYFSISSAKTVTLNSFPGFTLTVPAGPTWDGGTLHLGFYDPAKGWQEIGDLTLVGRTMTFTPTKGALTLEAGVKYVVAPFACTPPTPTPTPTCTTVPLAAGTQLPIPALGGFTGSWVAAANNAPGGTTVTLTTYLSAPSSAPSPQAMSRKADDTTDISPLLVKAPLLFVKAVYSTPTPAPQNKSNATSSSTITFDTFPAVSFALPSGSNTNGVTFELQTFDLTTGALLDSENGMSSGRNPVVESFPGTDTQFVVNTGHAYLWELVSVPLPTWVTAFTIPTANGFPAYITSEGADLWFTETSANKIGRITTGGTITEFSAGTATGPYDIITGPDGNPWFGAQLAQGLGRIAASGIVTFVPIPTASAHPEQLVADRAHNSIWFVERVGQKIGVYDLTTKVMTQYPVPPFGPTPGRLAGIALDRSGNVWFSDSTYDQVDEMSSSGTLLRRLTLPGSTGVPFSLNVWYMTLGDDGNLWLLEMSGGPQFTGAIARIDPTTLVITTLVPSGSSPAGVGIAGGPGGIWVPGSNEDLIRTSYSGDVSEFVIPGSNGYGIVDGPDNNMWFVDQPHNTIDRVTISELPASSAEPTETSCREKVSQSKRCSHVVVTR